MRRCILESGLLFGTFVLPPIILYSDTVSHQFSLHLLGVVPAATLIIYLVLTKVSLRTIGLSLNFHSLRAIIPRTISLLAIGFFLLAIVPWLLGSPRSLYLQINVFHYSYITVFQEIVWRGFAFFLLERIFGNRQQTIILSSAILFAFMHIYFRSILLVLGTLLLGIEWGRHYWKFRSITGPVIAHYLFGLLAILLNYMGVKESWKLF